MPAKRECDLIQAVEKAAFEYIFRGLIHRIDTEFIQDSGITAENVDAAREMTRDAFEQFRNGIWRRFKGLPQRVLSSSLLECLDQKPQCCELFQREVENLLVEWVESLNPKWEGSIIKGEVKWREMEGNIKAKITDSLKACYFGQQED